MATQQRTIARPQLTAELIRRCALLNWSTWPRDEDREQRIARWAARFQEPDSERCADWRLHLVEEGDRLAAMALSFVRLIACEGRRFRVMALAAVCSDPGLRGQGHGRLVVESAFVRPLEPALAWFFQTGVPGFYAKLGSRAVDNPIMTSSGDRAFWEPHAMIHPAAVAWPAGTVDLLGPGW